MATAYAALASLLNVLNRAQHPAYTASLDKSQIQSLFVKTSSLIDVLEASSHAISDDLKRKMMASAFAVGDWIESYLIESIQKSTCGGRETSGSLFSQDLDKAIQEMDSILQEAGQAKEQNSDEQFQQATSSLPVGSPSVPRGDSVKAVGLDEEVNRLMGQLTAGESSRQFIPIVGMGGLGKTTLATNVYHHPHVKRQFDVRAWVTISQVYTARTIIDPLLRDIGVSDTKKIEDEELGLRLHQGLLGRIYLIVIDDIWDVGAWDEISRFCPDNNNGSRILFTTRILDVVNRLGSCSSVELQLLDVDRSWDLLSETVFGRDACPSELEHCGKEIARKCKGLPLAIVVIGGALKASNRTQEHWEYVERNISSIISVEDDEHCMKILSLSYNQLPLNLKPCFLHLATYSEDSEVQVSVITKLWAADGFLKPNADGETLEDVALECLDELINRNLIVVKERTKRRRVKLFTVHDLVRDLCIKEAKIEMLLCADNGVIEFSKDKENKHHFISRGKGYVPYRSLICLGWKRLPAKWSDTWEALLYSLVGDMIVFVNIRFLEISVKSWELSECASISLLSHLETLIADVDDDHSMDYTLTCEIWKLRHIRHLIFSSVVRFPDPPAATDVVLQNLQTLMEVFITSEEVLRRIPNVKKLKVSYVQMSEDEEELIPSLIPRFDQYFHKVEALRFFQIGCLPTENISFSRHLGKLTLAGTKIPWENMTIVGSLPNLEFLALAQDGFHGKEWNSVEGEFQSLKHLFIFQCHLVIWRADDCSHFPCLQRLELHYMKELEEIPEVLAELMTLTSIKVHRCSESVAISARQILEEQQSTGNYDLAVEVVHHIPPSQYTRELEAVLKGLPNDHFDLKIDQSHDWNENNSY